MRSKQSLSASEQLLSLNSAIDVTRVRSSDSTEPVHTASKNVTPTSTPSPMTPPRNSSTTSNPVTPVITPRLSFDSSSPWRCKDTSSIFRAAPTVRRTTEIPDDFWTILRSDAFDEDDAEF